VNAAKPPKVTKSLRPVLGVSAVVLLILLGLGGAKRGQDLAKSRQRVAELEEGIRAAEERIRALERLIERLKTDPQMLERRAREDLGLAFPDDLIYLLPEEPSQLPAPTGTEESAPESALGPSLEIPASTPPAPQGAAPSPR
jgi:cell division protein FtsB